MRYFISIALLIAASLALKGQQALTIYGKVMDAGTKAGISDVSVRVQNSTYTTVSDKQGRFSIRIPSRKHVSLLFSHLSYDKRVREFDVSAVQDSLRVTVTLDAKTNELMDVPVYADRKPDTLVSSPTYSIYDFDFYEDQFILLTSERNLGHADLRLSSHDGRILHTLPVPRAAGLAKELYRDYTGYINLVCEQSVYRIQVLNQTLVLKDLNPEDFNAFVKPIIDTLNGKIIFTDYWSEYPLFNYYTFDGRDSSKRQLISISDEELMHAYNFEYYAMKPKDKLIARSMANDLKSDKHVIAALMTGFTKSLFYDPLYAPLFIVKDTMCVFDHYKDMLFHFDSEGHKLDSVAISYNHPKNWKEWKRRMLKDDLENTIYAVYDRNGHKYVRLIDHRSGQDQGLYNLQFYSADKLKIRDGYAYYIYRPFESTQQKFLYRELIRLER